MPPTVVAHSNVPGTFKTALDEILRSYFDGNTHRINDQDLEFNEPEFVYDVHNLASPFVKPIKVAILGVTTGTEEQHKVTHPLDNQKHAVEIWADITRAVVIAQQYQGGVDTANRAEIDRTWGLLANVLGWWSLWSPRGIINPKLSPLPRDLTSDERGIEAHGLLECRVKYTLARYNITP